MEKIKTFLRQNKKRIDERIFEHLPTEHEIPEVRNFYEMMWDYPSRKGKGLRPTICLLMCDAFGGKPEKALNTAAALELLENWLLVHDDIEDGSELRRGKPCLHRKYGIPMAINVGDALHCKMWEILHENTDILGYELAFRILSEFTRLADETMAGQHIELSWVENNRWNLTDADYYAMCGRKTSWYTCIAPCRLGAIIAGAEDDEIDNFIQIGWNLGIAFQIQDDVLNLIGDEGVYGKEIAGDISEGKRTLVLIHLLSSCTKEEALEIFSIMNKPREDKLESEIKRIIKLMDKYDSIKYAKSRAKLLVEEAKELFNEKFADLPNTRSKEAFIQLIDFVIDREY